MLNKIYNEDCLLTMKRPEYKNKVNLILTSPPYNTSRINRSDKYDTRYIGYSDDLSDEEYINWSVDLFHGYSNILCEDGCVLYNISYSSENTHLMWLVIAEIIKKTNFVTVDCIVWKKVNALPNNRSKNKLTRIVEYIFVFARKEEIHTFHTNKKVLSLIEKTQQKNYENIYNYIEAKNNDGNYALNKATFSTDLVTKLLNIYARPNSLVYDSFMGTGTTAKACIENNMNYIGSEISKEYCDLANQRINSSQLKLC